MDFPKSIDLFAETVAKKMTNIFRDVVIEAGSSVIRISPIDTGHFKGNWQLTIDGETSGEIDRKDFSGSATIEALITKANSLTIGQVAYILNHVEYGYDLEYGTYNGPTAKVTEKGFSRQAPTGMVRVTAARLQAIVEEAIRLNK